MTSMIISQMNRNIRVGRNMRHRRWMLGMTQEQLSQAIKVSLREIKDYEAGIREISSHQKSKIANALGVSRFALANGFDCDGIGTCEGGAVMLTREEALALLRMHKPTIATPSQSVRLPA